MATNNRYELLKFDEDISLGKLLERELFKLNSWKSPINNENGRIEKVSNGFILSLYGKGNFKGQTERYIFTSLSQAVAALDMTKRD